MSPRAPKKCGQDGCEQRVVAETYCSTHRAEAQARRPARQQRGYGADHDRRVRALRRASQADQTACWLCHQPINYLLRTPNPLSFSAHHLVRARSGPLVATHKVCNERAGQPAT